MMKPKLIEIPWFGTVVVHVLLFKEQQLFLLRREKTGFMDGYYSLPGGHQRAGESVEDAARRECQEEAGVVAGAMEAVCVMPYRSGRHQGLNFVFEVTQWEGDPKVGEPELFSEARWVTPPQMPRRAVPWIADVLQARQSGVWFRELTWR